jgi:hypothetical protein
MQRLSHTVRGLRWQPIAAIALLLCLFALLSHPVSAHAIQQYSFLLLPVFLFGLIALPRSLWPASDDQHFQPFVVSHTDLFQRPPPFSQN